MLGVRLVRLVCVVFLGVGLCLGLGCASKKLTLHPVVSNVYNVEGFPVVTVSDDYKLVQCKKYDQSGLSYAECFFLKKNAGPHGGSIYLTVSSFVPARDGVQINESLKKTQRTIEFKRHTYIVSGRSVGLQDIIQQEHVALLEVFDSHRAQLFLFNVEMDVLPQEPRDDAATLELMLGLMDQAIVSIEP